MGLIRLKQIITEHGETMLVFEADFPDGAINEVRIPAAEIIEKMRDLKSLVGRKLTLNDVKDIIVATVNQIRKGKEPLERFDLSQYIGMDLEQ